jgi:hypothetical protein
MLSFIKILLIFFIFHSNQANETELLKQSIEDLKEEFNYSLNNAIKIQEIYRNNHEKKIEEMMKKYSDLNEKFHDINYKICYPKEFRSEKINKTDEEIENQINSFVENKSKSLLFIFHFS